MYKMYILVLYLTTLIHDTVSEVCIKSLPNLALDTFIVKH